MLNKNWRDHLYTPCYHHNHCISLLTSIETDRRWNQSDRSIDHRTKNFDWVSWTNPNYHSSPNVSLEFDHQWNESRPFSDPNNNSKRCRTKHSYSSHWSWEISHEKIFDALAMQSESMKIRREEDEKRSFTLTTIGDGLVAKVYRGAGLFTLFNGGDIDAVVALEGRSLMNRAMSFLFVSFQTRSLTFPVTFGWVKVDHSMLMMEYLDEWSINHRWSTGSESAKPFVLLTLPLSLLEEVDCLARTNDGNGGVDVVGFSSDFVCRGGIGGGRGIVVEFFFDSLSIKEENIRLDHNGGTLDRFILGEFSRRSKEFSQ